MKNNFFINQHLSNIYFKPTDKSDVSSQILYGEKFSVISKKGKWIKIKTNYDRYIGYIKEDKFTVKYRPTHKII